MMNWLYYLLEANLYLAVFYGFYRVFLQKETYYSLNRYYLIGTTLLAFALPVLQIGHLHDLLTDKSVLQLPNGDSGIKANENPLVPILIWTYLLVSTGFLVRLAYSLYGLLTLAIAGKKQKQGNVITVDLNNTNSAFSFFNLLFINPIAAEKDTILKHEMVHISQNHSLDILFFEFIQILNWFSPITWMIKKDIKLVHEYIADDITTTTDIPRHEYAMFLIQNSLGNGQGQLTNQIFNQSILKRRITMLNQKKSAGSARLKLLLTVPIAGSMLCASTLAFSKDYALIDLYPEKYRVDYAINQDPKTVQKQDTSNRKQIKFPPPIVKKNEKSKAPKREQIKFPPPVAPPPPPTVKIIKFPPPKAEKAAKKKEIKFPPPIVTKDKIEKVDHELPPPPPVEPPPPPVKKSEG